LPTRNSLSKDKDGKSRSENKRIGILILKLNKTHHLNDYSIQLPFGKVNLTKENLPLKCGIIIYSWYQHIINPRYVISKLC
jgi:hypothetical protein